MAEYKLNFPIVTPEAYAFWESRHKLNRIKAIIAFSLDLDNANDNLRRKGYYRQYRKRYVELYKELVAHPDMQGAQFEFSGPDDYWWNPKVPPSAGPVTPVNITFAASDVSATYTGYNGSGVGTFTTTKNVTLNPASKTGLSTGDTVAITVTPKRTVDTINGKPTDTVNLTVPTLVAPTAPLVWGAHPATGTIGTDIDFSWKGGVAPFTVVVLNPAGTEHDRVTHTSPYTLDTHTQDSGEWTVTIEDSSAPKQTISQKVQMAKNAIDQTYVAGDITYTVTGHSGQAILDVTSIDKEGTTVAFNKTTGIANGDVLIATITGSTTGSTIYTVNGKASDTITYPAVSGLEVEITLAKTDFTVTFAGDDGAGTATVTSSNANVTAVVDPADSLSNGDTVSVTATPKAGYVITGTNTFEFDVTGLKVALRSMHVWIQDNSHNSVNLGPRDPNAAVLEYDWDLHTVGNYNYPGVRLRYDDTTYSGATGEAAIKSVSATTSDVDVVKIYVSGSQSPDATIPTPPINGSQFAILKQGNADITYIYEHKDDPTVQVKGILHVVAN